MLDRSEALLLKTGNHLTDVSLSTLQDVRPKYRILQDLIRQGIDDHSLTQGGSKLPSEHDMARAFGVAYMTVRAAVNELVSEGLLQRIHGKGTFVRQTSPVAQTSAGVIALVVPSLQSLWNVAGLYYFPGIVQGFCAEATRLGYEPSVIGRTRDAALSASGEFASLVGAACLLISREDSESLEAMRDLGVPVVGINHYRGRRAITSVVTDQAGGMEEAVKLLADQGHKHIAFLPGPEGNLGAEERQRGFLRAASALGLSTILVEDEPRDYTDLSGVVRTRALMARERPPTAIVTAGDLIAAGVVQAAHEMGLSIPGDLSVIGYGDFEVASYLQPGLTTVRIPLRDLGAQAAELIHEQASGKARRKTTSLSTTLIQRGSVAPPRA
jgi:DNA-binding LacI/PurR family transcriptional regulator